MRDRAVPTRYSLAGTALRVLAALPVALAFLALGALARAQDWPFKR